MGMDHRKVKAYLLYTRYPLLYPSRPSWAMVRRVIDLRNRIVADEYGVQLRNSLEYTAQKLEEINASTLNERGLKGRFWETYLRPSIDNFQSKLKALSPLERITSMRCTTSLQRNFIPQNPVMWIMKDVLGQLLYGFLH